MTRGSSLRGARSPLSALLAVMAVAMLGLVTVAATVDSPVGASTQGAATRGAMTQGAPTAVRLFGFDDKETSWVTVNDGVMGGVSAGSLSRKDGVLTFSGRVSLKNNGGFASTRSNSKLAPLGDNARAFVFRAKGDGTTYQFTVDTDDGWFWASTKPTKGTWETVRVEFGDLKPVTRFGEPTKRRAFDGSQKILTTGFLIANKRAEKFSLSLDWLDADA
jgi:NADH dehydrogenase [ubiquinone] 1 alpha subcomplex assembly factor 1